MRESKTAMPENTRKRAPGAGIKSQDGVTPTNRRNIMIDTPSLEILKKIGDGNLSLGIREAVRRLIEINDTSKFTKKRHKDRHTEVEKPN